MSEPITAAEAAEFLRLDGASDSPTPELALMNRLIEAARVAAENFMNRSVTAGTRTLVLDDFTSRDSGVVSSTIPLPFGDVSTVDSISYVDDDGATQTVSSHILSENQLTPAFGETWPSTRSQIGAVTITYTAGYADINSPAENGTPKPIVQAMYLILDGMYEVREETAQGAVGAYHVNPVVERLLMPYHIDMGI